MIALASESANPRRSLALWLFAVAALVFLMVVVGGITRLTESGLSMVEWRPVTGWLPPLSDQAWQAEFDKYKAFPEYQKVNRGMTLGEFQTIFAWEFGHRLLGRIIGLAFFLPMVWFMLRGVIRRPEVPWFLFLLLAGGSQGLLGWYMVQSGLIDDPDVSQYRLAAHLSLAVAIYGLLVWTGLNVRSGRSVASWGGSGRGFFLTMLVFLQIVMGAFVAGTNAGFAFNDWPLMDGALVPDGLFSTSPWWLSLFEDIGTIQFTHRLLAYGLIVAVLLTFLQSRAGPAPQRKASAALLHGVLLQSALGVATLWLVVPVWLGALHQATATLVWTAALLLLFRSRTAA